MDREALIEQAALASVNARREPSERMTSLRSLFHWDQETERDAARAALAVIEPVVREAERDACKRVIDGGFFLHDKAPTRLWANEVLAAIDRDAAIRGGSNGG